MSNRNKMEHISMEVREGERGNARREWEERIVEVRQICNRYVASKIIV